MAIENRNIPGQKLLGDSLPESTQDLGMLLRRFSPRIQMPALAEDTSEEEGCGENERIQNARIAGAVKRWSVLFWDCEIGGVRFSFLRFSVGVLRQ